MGDFLPFNSLASGRCGCNFKWVIFKHILMNDILRYSRETMLVWMPQKTPDDKSTLVQVMAWCHQGTRHYLSHQWPRSMSPGHNELIMLIKLYQYRYSHCKDKTVSRPYFFRMGIRKRQSLYVETRPPFFLTSLCITHLYNQKPYFGF